MSNFNLSRIFCKEKDESFFYRITTMIEFDFKCIKFNNPRMQSPFGGIPGKLETFS